MDKFIPLEDKSAVVALADLRALFEEADRLEINLNDILVEGKPAAATFDPSTVNAIKTFLLKGQHYRRSEQAAIVVASAHCPKVPD
jgi:uncharacterized protein (UPF0335 family)